jgi:pyridoxal phosphate enzyme (YggS family)
MPQGRTTSSTWETTISTSPPSSASDDVAGRLLAVRQRIERAGGDPSRVRVVGVTKGFGPEAVAAARQAGLTDLGENYAAQLVEKAAADRDGDRDPDDPGVVWHFLGAVQRNKVAQLAPLVGLWQSVARVAEGERIARFAPRAQVLVQVETTGQAGRNGCSPAEAGELVARLRDLGLQVRGLMTVAAPGEGAAGEAFATLGRLADRLGLEERSMGMSDDLEAAVAAGSTMVRIGRALFGARPPAGAASG